MATSPRRIGVVEWGCLLVLAALPAGALVWFALRGADAGLSWTGTDGGVVVDFMQYVDWIRQSADHGLVGDLYGLDPPHHVFLHPGVLLSGLVTRAGVDPVISYLLWTPVAVLVVWAGARSFVGRHLTRPGDRRLGLVLALFAVSPTAAAVGWFGHLGNAFDRFGTVLLAGEMWSGTQLWGYVFAAIAVGLVPLALVAYERGRSGDRRRLAQAALAGGLAAWLQPWQGATLVLVLVAAETVLLLRARAGRRDALDRLRILAIPAACTLAPLVYYFLLSQLDPSWENAGRVNRIFPPRGAWWIVPLTLLPVAPALLAYRLPAPRFGDVALRAWPLVALVLYLVPGVTFPSHSWQGVQFPLAVLLVLALRARLGTRPIPALVVVLALGVLVVPGTLHRLWALRGTVRSQTQAWYLEPGERAALRFLARAPGPGGVFADEYLGALVPALTGRATWVGAVSWTPRYFERRANARELSLGQLPVARARRLVGGSGARWLLTSCRDTGVGRWLGPAVGMPRRFGCAVVYPVRAFRAPS